MPNQFAEQPILNSPYEYPEHHWELDDTGQPTQRIIDSRRAAKFVTPIPAPKKLGGQSAQAVLAAGEAKISTSSDQYDVTGNVNEIRRYVDTWRRIPNPADWGVTP